MKILFVQTSFIGDCILSTSTLAGIRRLYPDAEISVLTAPRGEGVFQGNPQVSEVIVYDKTSPGLALVAMSQMAKRLSSKRFDVAYSLHRSWRTALLLKWAGIPKRIGFSDSKGAKLYTELRDRPKASHEVLRNWSLIEAEVQAGFAPCELELHIEDIRPLAPHLIDEWAVNFKAGALGARHGELLAGQGEKPIIALAPGSAWNTKRYPASLYREVVAQLVRQGIRVAVVGGPAEVELCQAVIGEFDFPEVMDFSGRLSIRKTFAVIAASQALITNDSMALHVGSAFKVPTVAIFCATSPSQGFGPWRNRATIVENEELWCRPCGRHGRSFCPTGSELCMRGIAPERIVRAVSNLLLSAKGETL